MDTIVLYAVAGAALLLSLLRDAGKTKKALLKGLKAFEGILPQFLVVLILVAATLAVLDTATISRFLGRESGALGVVLATLAGSVTLIPGFVAFPAAAALMRGGAGATQIAAFVSSLMMVGIVTLPMEMKYFGRRTAILRNSLAFLFSFAVALFVGWAVSL
jgi:uncharacterized membrane protein YraQ (UPF0718 family)